MKVLLIEDDYGTAEVIRICLEIQHPGTIIVNAVKGRDGIEMVKSEKPDLVILDLGLPDINGLQVLDAIRLFSEVPVMVTSAMSEDAPISTIKEKGANDYLSKPFLLNDFLIHFDNFISKSG